MNCVFVVRMGDARTGSAKGRGPQGDETEPIVFSCRSLWV